ncbi:glycosyltransferase [Ruficoccus amylovorans]|uniref:Glycosyltransferase n=1 Tax=Ruficoccus amylovorans TaxID=1804625 RepID=A0A842HCM6_9BACT|nr:glycosyltransferase family 2 protein [Ruficoccus amylovorans]MBC2593446.1 glycosyltransferase [Ruficoccus amylovorans]
MAKLDLFVLTYNRADYLRQTLASIRAQTFTDYRLIVLDNASTDHTAEVVREFGAEHRPTTENIGGLPNLLRIKELAEADWVMSFHDDDLMHPQLLEALFRHIDTHPACTLAACNFLSSEAPEQDDFKTWTVTDAGWDFVNVAHLTSFCLTLNTVAFSSSIYRREAFLRMDPERYAPFGKIGDRPIMLDLCGEGTAFVLKDAYVNYRIHAGQDSSQGPGADEIIAMTRYYRGLTGTSWKTPWGRSFIVNNRAFLKNLYKWSCDRPRMSFNRFVWRALKAGACTRWVLVPRPLMRIVKKILRRRDPLFF